MHLVSYELIERAFLFFGYVLVGAVVAVSLNATLIQWFQKLSVASHRVPLSLR
jgi:hypothetical protein